MPTHLPHLKHLFIVAVVALIAGHLNAQTTWHSSQSSGQYTIEYSDPVICSFSQETVQAEYIYLRVTNLTSHPLTISFRVDHYYVGTGCGTCNNDEYQYSFTIPANLTISGDCSFSTTHHYNLSIFKKFITKPNNREFDKFEITNIQVE